MIDRLSNLVGWLAKGMGVMEGCDVAGDVIYDALDFVALLFVYAVFLLTLLQAT